MRGRAMLTGLLAGVMLLSAAGPAAALFGGGLLGRTLDDVADTLVGEETVLGDSALAPLLDGVTDPLFETVTELEVLVDEVVADLGPGPLDDQLLEAILATGTMENEVHDLLGYGWSSHLPAYPDGDHVPSTYDDCPPRHNQCVDQVIREMRRRYDGFGCDHTAIFSLTYKLTTMAYREAVEDPDYFRDNGFVNHQDVVFAEHYFQPLDDWYAHDRIARVPPAWRIAFDAADRTQVSTTGDVMLGMNAHIRRDLPFVLAAIGMVTEEGETRKADHDRVNDFLADVQSTITEELQLRHDPAFGTTSLPLRLDEHAIMHAIRLWREEAWRKAELLVAAPTEAAHDRVAQLIETDAALSAVALRTAFGADDADARLAHCRAWREGR